VIFGADSSPEWSVVVMSGANWLTTVVSPRSPQAPATGSLLGSPLYEAIQWKSPFSVTV
jgi:hypothetical protein